MAKNSAKKAAKESAGGDLTSQGARGETQSASVLARRHLKIGWWMVLVFLSLGIGLEALHALKIGWYLDVSNETRRLMMILAHSHGVLIGVLHLGFAFTAAQLAKPPSRLASRSLTASGVLLPGGFLLGGLVIHGGDPGKGILLVPVGALLLFTAVLSTALKATR